MPKPNTHLRDQVSIIAKHEQEFLERRNRAERLGDSLGSFIGSLTFVAIHIAWFGAWIVVNLFPLGLRRFDPPPFSLLNVIVALEAIFLASFIVMRQSRESRRSYERDHLMLQILMLAEKEITAVLGVERDLADRLGLKEVANDAEIEQLSRETSIDDLARTLNEELAENPSRGN
jgi:uncharacterized membrane protein